MNLLMELHLQSVLAYIFPWEPVSKDIHLLAREKEVTETYSSGWHRSGSRGVARTPRKPPSPIYGAAAPPPGLPPAVYFSTSCLPTANKGTKSDNFHFRSAVLWRYLIEVIQSSGSKGSHRLEAEGGDDRLPRTQGPGSVQELSRRRRNQLVRWEPPSR